MIKKAALLGVCLGWGAQKLETEQGPRVLQQFRLAEHLKHIGLDCYWRSFIEPVVRAEEVGSKPFSQRIPWILETNKILANAVQSVLEQNEFPIVLGGDHAIAIGTWTGVTRNLHAASDFGLIWVDAHMDSHTPETTPSQTMHGMPLAVLMGYGQADFVELDGKGAHLNPQHVVLIGARAYEEGEQRLLEKLGVHIFYMEEIRARGLASVLEDAYVIVSKATKGFGITIDLDAFDPIFAPGVGSPESGGLNPEDFYPLLKDLVNKQGFKAMEITEYNPTLDQDFKTAMIVQTLIEQLL